MERNQTSLKIKENEEVLNKIFDHAPVIMMIVNKNAEIVKINRTASSGFAEGQIVDKYNCKNVFNCIGESIDAIGIGNSELCANCVVNNTLKKTIKTGKEVFKKEADIITLRESEIGLRTYLISSSLIEKGKNLKVLLTFDDITDRKRIEEELLLSKEKSVYNEKRYRLLSNLTFEGIMLHQNRKIIDVNRALLKMTGYSYPELIGQDSMSFIFPPEYEDFFKEKMMEEYSLPYETEIIDKRGGLFPVEIESRYFKQHNQRIRVSAIRDITERKEGEKKILQAVVNTEESERARFAQELHDGLGPILSNVQMYFQWLADEDDNKQFVFEKGNQSLKNAFATLREISNKLSPHILHNFGLVNAVNNFIETMVTKNIRIDFKTNIEGKRFSGDIEISMYRIVNELVNNTIKYSGANKIGLELVQSDIGLKLFYTDNGKGFDIDHVQKKGKGFGMINIHNRIKTIQGSISVKSKINKGVEVEINVPIK
jgi:PAS domain S-box-containing protein